MEKRKYPTLFIIGFLFLYFLIGMVTGFLGAKEFFPFFSWSLFSWVTNNVNKYSIIVDEYNGVMISPPQLFPDAKEIIQQSDSIVAHNLILDFGSTYERKEIAKAERLRKLFEANFMKAPARYRLVRIIYNPVERWKTGKFEIIYVREFAVGRNTL